MANPIGMSPREGQNCSPKTDQQHRNLSAHLHQTPSLFHSTRCPQPGGWDREAHLGPLVPTTSGLLFPKDQPPRYYPLAFSIRHLRRQKNKGACLSVCSSAGGAFESLMPVFFFSRLSPRKGSLQVYCMFRCPMSLHANYQGGFTIRVPFPNLPNDTAVAVFKMKIKFFL